MLNLKLTFESLLTRLLIALPLLSLFLGLMAWLRYGYDLPFFDDWRGYNTGEIDSLNLSYLFRPANGTLWPVGVALDALAQRYLDGNSIAYQALSMVVVLGSLLALQWHLLKSVLGNRLHAAMCFALTLFMLQPGSYWGRENLAYHQALPVVFLLAALVLIVHPTWRNRWRLPGIFVLGVLSGMSYISGAFGACAAAAACVALAWVMPASAYKFRLSAGGVAFGLAGLAMAALQYVLAALPYMRLSSTGAIRSDGGGLALPHEAEFWFFYLGKIGRSLLLPAYEPIFSLTVVLLVCGATLFVTTWIVRRVTSPRAVPSMQSALRTKDGHPDAQLATILVALVAVVFVYLMLIAAGRTHFREPDIQSAMQVFAHGFTRFHFFWATLLWPWVLAAVIALLRKSSVHRVSTSSGSLPGALTGSIKYAVLPLTLIMIVLMIERGAFSHASEQRGQSNSRLETVGCLINGLQSGKRINCHELNLPDLIPAYKYAAKTNASFVRYFPLLPTPLGVDDPLPLYRFSTDNSSSQFDNFKLLKSGNSAATAAVDSKIVVQTGQPEQMGSCNLLDVRLLIRPTLADAAQVFFKAPGQLQFEQSSSQMLPLLPRGEPQLITFRLESAVGFQDELRLDPVNKPQDLDLLEFEVRCRRRIEAAPFFVLTPGVDQVRLVNMELDRSAQYSFRSQIDPMLIFTTGRSTEMSRCATLIFSANIQVPQAQLAQLFYLPKGAKAYSQESSISTTVQPSTQLQRVAFRANSPKGFEDEIRFDPVTDALNFRVRDVQMSCAEYVKAAEPQRCDANLAGSSGRP